MNVVGYTDLLSVEPGETLRVMVSCALDEYRADLVRLIHGDPNPDGPGVKEEEVPSAIDGPHPGREQSFPRGSCVMVPDSPLLRLTGSFTVRAYVQSTTPGKGVQGLVTKWSGDDGGYGLFIGDDGSPSLWIGDGAGGVERLSTGVPLVEGQWYILTASFDSSSRRVTLHQRQTGMWAMDEYAASVERETSSRGPAENDAPLIVAGCADGLAVRNHFNGRIEAPRLWNRAVPPEEAGAVAENGLVAAWDFAEDTSSARIADVSGNRLDGTALNMPMRAVTGHDWRGRESDFRRAPEQYGAIHFHDDDLEDARWEPDFELTVPDDVRSAVYAVRLRAGTGPGSESYAPFFVRPKRGGPTAPILFLAPTNTYIAYADTHAISHPSTRARYERMGIVMPEDYPWLPEDRYVIDQELLSLYDRHSDDSGVCYSTRLRPILNLNPKYRGMGSDQKTMGPHILGADLHLLDWMEVKGFDYDVLTDQDLHFEGAGALAPYRVVLTGTHPEYWTERMLDGLEEYLASGGRLMYLGGNGFYWVTSLDPERPHVIEIRRWGGTGPWKAQAGEYHHSTTGELGGVWRSRGKGAAADDRCRLRFAGLRTRDPLPEEAGQLQAGGRLHIRGSRRRAYRGGRSRDGRCGWLRGGPHRSGAGNASSNADRRHRVGSVGRVPALRRGAVLDRSAPGRVDEPGRPRRHGLLQGAERGWSLLGRLHRLVRLPIPKRLRQPRVEDNRERAAEVLFE